MMYKYFNNNPSFDFLTVEFGSDRAKEFVDLIEVLGIAGVKLLHQFIEVFVVLDVEIAVLNF